jgi:FtsP/CotA-like multicopper oxidase with cupredoxin domain
LVTCALSARAQQPGCEYKDIDVAKYGNQPFQNPPSIESQNGSLSTTLTVQYTDAAKTSLGGCPLKLRSYNGLVVGPTLRIKPGDVLDVNLNNQLPKETPDEIQAQFNQENSSAWLGTMPNSYNTTNLLFHGLHVSPAGNSDNVLLAIAPQSQFAYEVKVPSTHPIGTYWYHAHAHGSTAIQVGSSMAGAIIIEDDPNKIPKSLRDATANEKILVIQTILYDTDGKLDDITKLFPGPAHPNPTNCAQAGNLGTWPCAKRWETVNGQIVPIITMRPGEVQRWRLIDTSFRESVSFFVQGHPLYEIALDGNYLGRVDMWPANTPLDLEPGYRSDVLIQALQSDAGKTFQMFDAPSPAATSLRGVEEPEHLLAILKVDGEPMNMALPTSAEMAPLAPFGGTDLRKTALGVQQVTFKLGGDMQGQKGYFQVNYQSFNPTHIRQLVLNSTEMWALTTVGDPTGVPNPVAPPPPHVFHIHVNPFQWARTGPDGKPELVWKDTLLVQGPAITNIYTKYTDYIGQFVMHCHILDHEDLGMMEMEEVVDSASGVRNGHHH